MSHTAQFTFKLNAQSTNLTQFPQSYSLIFQLPFHHQSNFNISLKEFLLICHKIQLNDNYVWSEQINNLEYEGKSGNIFTTSSKRNLSIRGKIHWPLMLHQQPTLFVWKEIEGLFVFCLVERMEVNYWAMESEKISKSLCSVFFI